MVIKSLHIGRLTVKNNVFLAPLAGFSNRAFRQICSELGAGLTFTEMVSAKGLKYNNRQTCELLKTSDAEQIKAAQLFGADPSIMREACESKHLEPFDIVDINMGCPVPKVFNNGEGSALLNDVHLAEKIVSECVRSGKTVTVKMRKGVKKGETSALDLAKAVANAGASLITVHGRTREDYYSGDVDFEIIKKIKESVDVPVIANGGIFSVSDAEKIVNETGADGIMLARGALFKPELFSRILCESDTFKDKKALINRHIDLLLQDYTETVAIKSMRKQLAFYVHGIRGSKAAKLKIFSSEYADEIREIISELDFQTQ